MRLSFRFRGWVGCTTVTLGAKRRSRFRRFSGFGWARCPSGSAKNSSAPIIIDIRRLLYSVTCYHEKARLGFNE
jgi:hypothetical protein